MITALIVTALAAWAATGTAVAITLAAAIGHADRQQAAQAAQAAKRTPLRLVS